MVSIPLPSALRSTAIVETEHPYGGNYEDAEPAGFVFRIGCENCDYEIDKEYFDI